MRKILIMVCLFVPAFVCAETIEYALPVGNVSCDVGTGTTDAENIDPNMPIFNGDNMMPNQLKPVVPQIYVEERIVPSLQITPKLVKRTVTVVPTDMEVKGTIKSQTTTHLLIWNVILTIAFVAAIL